VSKPSRRIGDKSLHAPVRSSTPCRYQAVPARDPRLIPRVASEAAGSPVALPDPRKTVGRSNAG
jgi:hypothetical protein